VSASWKSIDVFYCYCSASSGYFSMLRKITGKQSRILWIHDEQKCTIAWWFETKENYNEDNKQHEWKSAQYFPQLRLKIRCLKTFQFIWNPSITLSMDSSYWGPSLKKIIGWFLIPAQSKNFRGNFWLKAKRQSTPGDIQAIVSESQLARFLWDFYLR